jgi:2-isopropylmalate synthase
LISELSGRSNIVAMTSALDIQHDRELMDKILARVVELESRGYQFEAAQGSFDLLIRRCAGTFRSHFERLNFRVNVETAAAPTNGAASLVTEATVKLQIGQSIKHEVAEGDGPVNALDAALRKALAEAFPNLADMQLVDYKVRVINTEAGTAAVVRVVIESRDEHEVWGTVGVSENVIEASWIALVDSFEYKLCKDEAATGKKA